MKRFLLVDNIYRILLCCGFLIFSVAYSRGATHALTDAWWAWPGQEISIYKRGWFSCSVGFPAIDTAGNHYFITAGHCFRNEDLTIHYFENVSRNEGAQVYSPNDPNNPVGWERYYFNPTNGVYLDISLVEMYQGKRIYGSGWEHIPNDPIDDPGIGDTACLVGYRHDTVNCGTIVNKNIVASSVDSTYNWERVDMATYCSHPGDSGGAVYNSNGALGINVSGDFAHNEPGTPGVCNSGFVPINFVLTSLKNAGFPDLRLV